MTLPIQTRQLSDDLYALFDGRNTSTATRELLAAGAHDAVHEHHRAIAYLVSESLYSSAYALLRAMFDGCLRGLWLTHVATEDELNRFTEETYDPKPERVLKLLEGKNVAGAETLRQIYDAGWKVMSNYVHGGFRQVVGRLGTGFIGSNYSEQEVSTLLQQANWFALLAAVELAAIASDEQLLQSLVAISERYAATRA